ncbi:MAG TPA: hypothetical protein VFQ54_09160, partial [Thermomicrobiales bacterium]|nr:hypothetical protein [Thermomicrobiales bacterium]
MYVRQAKDRAKSWVDAHASATPGFAGAYLAGSILDRDDAVALPSASDVDLMVVVAGDPTTKSGKIVVDGVILEITLLPRDQFQSAVAILPDYHLAHSFAKTTLLADPTGALTPLQRDVANAFGDPEWIRRRCADARSRVVGRLSTLSPDAPFHQQVVQWMFGNGVVTHVLLVAGLQNPTVRTRYVAVRDLLARTGHAGIYEPLLALIGCRDIDARQLDTRLDA